MSPLVPGSFQGMKDLFTRGPLWSLKSRPTFLQPKDLRRLDESVVEKLKTPGDHMDSSSRAQKGREDITGEGSSTNNSDSSGDNTG